MNFYKSGFLAFSFIILFSSCGNKKTAANFEAMNTFMTVQVYGNNGEDAINKVMERINQIEDLISVTKTDSEIYRINSSKEEVKCSEDTLHLAAFSREMAEKTQGALNPALYPIIKEWGFTTGQYKIPSKEKIHSLLKNTEFNRITVNQEKSTVLTPEKMELDFGAIGKGFAGDEAIKILKENGIKSALLDLGGNIQTLGTKPDGSQWKIGIKNPWGGSPVAGLQMKEGAVVTSGGYERYFTGDDGKKYIHIFDGKTGFPVENSLESVTIVSNSGLYADSLSTSLFVMGLNNAVDFWNKYKDFEMIILTKEKELYFTEGLENQISVLFDFTRVEKIKAAR